MAASLSNVPLNWYGMHLHWRGALWGVCARKSFAAAFTRLCSPRARANKSFPQILFFSSPQRKEDIEGELKHGGGDVGRRQSRLWSFTKLSLLHKAVFGNYWPFVFLLLSSWAVLTQITLHYIWQWTKLQKSSCKAAGVNESAAMVNWISSHVPFKLRICKYIYSFGLPSGFMWAWSCSRCLPVIRQVSSCRSYSL